MNISIATVNKNNVGCQHLSIANVGVRHKTIFVSDLLGEKIKEARKRKGFTLKSLGEKIGRSHATLSQIENSVHKPEKATLIALAKELDNNFGEEWLDEYLLGNETVPSKKEIIENASVEEIFTLKFGNKRNRRTREEILKLRKLAERQLEQMLDLDE